MDKAERYDPQAIEAKWQPAWRAREAYRTPDVSDKPQVLLPRLLPVPVGRRLSVGHCRNYVPTDAVSRYKRMRGFNVLHPMGWDAFGLPAENDAIKQGVHPRVTTERNIANYKRQMDLVGLSLRLVARDQLQRRPTTTAGPSGSSCCSTSAGSPTGGRAPVVVPGCKTILANEQVERGRAAGAATATYREATSSSGSSGSPPTPSGCSTTWRPSTGPRRSSSCRPTGSAAARAPRSTSRVAGRDDTLTRLHDPARHALGRDLHGPRARASAGRRSSPPTSSAPRCDAYQDAGRAAQSEIERLSTDKEKTGVFTGAHAINPSTASRSRSGSPTTC